ncbi:MAG: ATP-binding protein [Gammaproteobacteria bacterium]|nr:ATP-binding protein [Gammaproteobacteria bacterium]
MAFKRDQVATLVNRLTEPPKYLQTVIGPRQTGKTTIVRQALRHLESIGHGTRYVSADDSGDAGFPVASGGAELAGAHPGARDAVWLEAVWREAREAAEQSGGLVLAIDEIQRVPDWSRTIKGLWDADRTTNCPLNAILLGSAPLLVQSGLNESLAGRFEQITVSHWSLQEMVNAFEFDLESYLFFGGYPGAAAFIRNEDRWRSYVLDALVQPNIERDILAMTRVDKPALLKRVFEVGSSQSGQVLSYTKMLGALEDAGNTTTLARYLDLLSSAGLVRGLARFAGPRFRTRGSIPKLNVLNTALMTATSGYRFEEASADRTFWGRLVESAVGAHLCNTATQGIEVRYWRESPHEVDFVLQRGPRTVAVEVKGGLRARGLRGLAEFRQRYKPDRTIVVGADGVPLNEFLALPAAAWLERS